MDAADRPGRGDLLRHDGQRFLRSVQLGPGGGVVVQVGPGNIVVGHHQAVAAAQRKDFIQLFQRVARLGPAGGHPKGKGRGAGQPGGKALHRLGQAPGIDGKNQPQALFPGAVGEVVQANQVHSGIFQPGGQLPGGPAGVAGAGKIENHGFCFLSLAFSTTWR